MSRKVTTRKRIAVTFVIALSLAGTVNASILRDSGSAAAPVAESDAGFLGLAWDWVSEAWSGLTGLFSFSKTQDGSSVPTSATTSSCADAGWMIDPNGCPDSGH
jgi:hypothetical protein